MKGNGKLVNIYSPTQRVIESVKKTSEKQLKKQVKKCEKQLNNQILLPAIQSRYPLPVCPGFKQFFYQDYVSLVLSKIIWDKKRKEKRINQ